MDNVENTDREIAEMIRQQQEEKEQQLVKLIVKIIVSSTLKEYYEKSDKIPPVQSTGAE